MIERLVVATKEGKFLFVPKSYQRTLKKKHPTQEIGGYL